MATFAASDQDRFIDIICGGYYYGYSDTAILKDIRLSNHSGLLHLCFNRSWSTKWKDNLSYFINHLFFIQ